MTDARLRITITGGPSPLGSERGRATPDRDRRQQPGHAVAGVGAGRGRAVAAQRPRRDRRAEDHVVRRERAGPRVRQRARRERGHLRQHPRRAVRGHRLQRVRRARRCAATPPATSGCLLGVTRALVLELAPTLGVAIDETAAPPRRVARRGRSVPHLDHAGGPDRSRRSTTAPARRPRTGHRRCSPPRSPIWWPTTSTPRSEPPRGRSPGAEVHDVGGGDEVLRAGVVAHDERAVVGDAGGDADEVLAARRARRAPGARAWPAGTGTPRPPRPTAGGGVTRARRGRR